MQTDFTPNLLAQAHTAESYQNKATHQEAVTGRQTPQQLRREAGCHRHGNKQLTIQNSMPDYLLLQIQPPSAATEPQHGFSSLMHLNFDNKALHTKNLLLHLLFKWRSLTISGTKENKWQIKKLPLQSYYHNCMCGVNYWLYWLSSCGNL